MLTLRKVPGRLKLGLATTEFLIKRNSAYGCLIDGLKQLQIFIRVKAQLLGQVELDTIEVLFIRLIL